MLVFTTVFDTVVVEILFVILKVISMLTFSFIKNVRCNKLSGQMLAILVNVIESVDVYL